MKRSDISEITQKKSKYLVITSDYILPFVIILTIFALFFVAFKTSLFSIKEIKCQRDFQPCQEPHLLTEIEEIKGKNLLHFKTKPLKNKILSSQKTIKKAEIKRILPHTLELELTSTTPKVALKTKNSQTWIVLDDALRVISIRDQDPALPTVIIHQTVSVQYGQPLESSNFNKSLKLAIEIASLLPNIKSITLSQQTLAVNLESGTKALLSTQKDTSPQIKKLQRILSADTIEKDAYNIIDLRFDQPVLKSN